VHSDAGIFGPTGTEYTPGLSALANWELIAGAGVAAPVVFAGITDGTDPIHYRAMAAVQARIRALALTGIASASVVALKLPLASALEAPLSVVMPAILISPPRDMDAAAGGSTGTDDVVYSVMVTVVAGDNQESTLAANLSRHLAWKQRIARAFRSQALPGATEVYDCKVQSSEAVIPAAWKLGYLATAMSLNFTAREPRGV
jgi:hypothetical protein